MNWKVIEDKAGDVTIKKSTDTDPIVIAVFDGNERVSQPVAALRVAEIHWMAEGYYKAKQKYI
jgi:hypothetical protein